MKKLITFYVLLVLVGISNAQLASDYFPSQTDFEWKLKAIPLDSASNPINSLAYYRIDRFESEANYEGKLANVVETKSGPLQTIQQQPFLDSLFFHTDGSDGYSYLSINNFIEFLIQLDSLGIDPNFNFVEFFSSLQDWYSLYRFSSTVGSEYTLLQVDTSITITTALPLRVKYIGTRLTDETIPTVLGNLNCKKFLIEWIISTFIFTQEIELLTLPNTVWIAPDNWIVQDIIPGQYIDDLTLFGIDPFSIPGLDVRLTDDIVSVENDESTPTKFALEQNYPNPFNPSTKIRYTIPNSSNPLLGGARGGLVTLKLYNILGKEIAILVNEEQSAGTYEIEFNADAHSGSFRNLPSGVYFYKLQAGSFVETKKMILMK